MVGLAAGAAGSSRAAAALSTVQMSLATSKVSSRGGNVSMAVATKSSTEVQTLLRKNATLVSALESIAPEMSEIARLRFALQFPDKAECETVLREAVAWRKGKGRAIVEAAGEAVAKATAGGGWDNEVVRNSAPHADVINPWITSKNIVTLGTDEGDLVYVIRASLIEDKKMMSKVSVDQFVDFLLYVKEVHSLIVNARSEATGRLCNVIFANDITGTRKAPDPQFSKGLTQSSKSYERLYPSYAGPTLILNLPFILQAFVGLFKPLFPKSVQARLRFERAPFLSKVGELTPLTTNAQTKKSFLAEVRKIIGK
jgi:hypothetical protein